MLHRVLHDPTPPAETDADTAAQIERGERQLRLLAELAEIGMRLTRSLGELADARIEAARKTPEAPTNDAEAAAAACEKMAQSVRRTLALEAKLAAGLEVRREGLATQRAERAAVDRKAKDDAIVYGLHDAYAADCPDDEYHALSDRLMEDAREYLVDADEMRGYLDRPVGETVAKLCAAMGLAPDACVHDGDTWRVRRPQRDFELRLDERARKFPPSSLPPLNGEGQIAQRSGWGSVDEIHRRC